jgi:hypothetical protein
MAEKFLGRLRALFAVLFNRPLRVRLHSDRSAYFYPGSRLVLPVIAGADGEGEAGEAGGEGGGEGGEGKAEAKRKEEEEEEEEEETGGGEGKEKDAEHYRKELRRTERRNKRAAERKDEKVAEAEKKLKEREEADQSEQEKAVTKAKEEGRTEALTEAQKERRADRLESAVIRAASKKVEVGEGDDKKTVRFDDPEDAELYLQQAIKKGDLDEDDLFDEDGKVKADVVAEALKEILEDKPKLAEEVGGSGDGKTKTADGGADQGKGKGPREASEDKSVEDLIKEQDARGK